MSKVLDNSGEKLIDIPANNDVLPYPVNAPQVVRGTNFDMGYQQGQLNNWRIRNWLPLIFADDQLGFFKLLKWPMRLAAPIMRPILSSYWKSDLQRYLPEILERMEGIARGAGCSVGEILYQQSVEILGAYPLHSGGCSTMIASSQFFEDNEPVIAKNFDYMPFLRKLQIVRKSYPDRGYASIEATVMPLAGSHAGLNECGLVVIYHYAYSNDKNQHGLPMSLFVQHLLQTCATVERAYQEIGRVPWMPSGMLLLADAHDAFAKVELSHSHLMKRMMANEWNVITNHLTDPEMEQYALSPQARFPKFLPPPWKGTRIRESSEMRFQDLSNLLQRRKKISLHDIQTILRDHGSAGVGSNNTVCRHSKISSTISSSIFLPSSLRMFFCNEFPCSGTFHEFHLKD